MARIKGSYKTVESFFMVHAERGGVLYTVLSDRRMQALAAYYGRKVRTERIVGATVGKSLEAVRVVRVTMMDNNVLPL